MRSLVEAAETAGRDLADNERSRFDALKGEVSGLEARIGRAESLAEMDRRAEAIPVSRHGGEQRLESEFRISRAVADWMDSQPAQQIWTTSVTVLEIRFGVETLPLGRRRSMISDAFAAVLEEDLSGRVLNFDAQAASETAVLMAARRAAGRPAGLADGMIAGIVRTRRASFATRNVRHFADAGIVVVDPWSE